MTAKRYDLPVEVSDVLDSGGNYTGDWVDSANINSIYVTKNSLGSPAPSFVIEGSMDGTNALTNSASAPTVGGSDFIPWRYFRIRTSSAGAAGASFWISARAT